MTTSTAYSIGGESHADYQDTIELAGKTVFVAGGTSGVNLGIAEDFARAGARVAVLSRSQDKVDATVDRLRALGAEAMGASADVRDYAATEATLNAAHDQFGPFDVLISGAAGNFPAAALRLSPNGFKSVVDIDLLGTFHVLRAAYPFLAKPGACVINISAPQAVLPTITQAHVCAAKAGVDMLTKVLALEWGPAGIRVNGVVPGPIEMGPFMTIILDAGTIAPADRAEAIRETIWNSVVRVEIEHHPEPEQIAARGEITNLGRLTISSMRSNATAVHRTARLAQDDMPPSVFLALQLSGSSVVIQGRREAVLRPGDLVLYDSTVPYTLLNGTGIHQHCFRIPVADLALPPSVISEVTARRLSPDRPVADLAATYFGRLAADPSGFGAGAQAIGQPSIELVRALITTQLPDPHLAREPLAETLQLRVMEYVRAHLAERDLTAACIAAKHHISVRHLYNILASSGISLGDWVRAHRLEECRKDLAKPGANSVTIAVIGQRWGFPDATNFGRAFKAAYGMSPREWRDLHQRQPKLNQRADPSVGRPIRARYAE